MAVERLKRLHPIENVGLGLGILVLASAVNGAVAFVLLREGKRLRSITLRADAQHLLTDVWTSAGVVVGVLLVKVTGWLVLDPVVALLVAANIVYTAVRLLQETGYGLLDRAIGEEEQAAMAAALAPFHERGIVLHDIRTRRAGPRHFIQMHVLVPGSWTVKRGHDVCEEIERCLASGLPGSTVTTHLEPVEDPSSWDDRGLDRHL
jgi:cation diffusion facilitator family transporter